MANKKFDLSVIMRVIDKASKPIKDIGRQFKSIGGPIDQAVKKFKKLGLTVQSVGKKLKSIGQSLSMRLTLPLILFAGLTVRSAIKFQAAMNMVGAVTQATQEEFAALTKLAKNLGATTIFSASEAAEGMKFLGMAGMKTKDIFGALPRVLELASSAQMDLGTAADIVTNIMSGFRFETSELARVNDILVNAFTNSNTDLQQLGEGMKVVGPVAKAMQFRFTETAAALGILAKNAFQGTLGGTGLRRIMTNLISPSKTAIGMFKDLGIKVKNSNGSLKDITGVLKEFEAALERGSTEMEVAQTVMEAFGQRGGPQFLALLGMGSKELETFESILRETGSAARVTEAQLRGLPGAFKLLASAFEAIQLAIIDSGIGKELEGIVRSLAKMMQGISEISPNFVAIASIIGILVAALGPLAILIGTVFSMTILATASAITAAFIGIASAIFQVIRYWKQLKDDFLDNPFSFIVDFLSILTAGIIPKFKEWKNLVRSMVPDFLLKKSVQLSGSQKNSKTDVNIKVTSDPGTTATIEKVKTQGDANVNMSTMGYVGATQ